MKDDPSVPPPWQIVLLVEAGVLGIALIMPITPSKTGSDWSTAELFFSDPSFLQEVFVYFVMGNLILALVAGAFRAHLALERRREGPEDG